MVFLNIVIVKTTWKTVEVAWGGISMGYAQNNFRQLI